MTERFSFLHRTRAEFERALADIFTFSRDLLGYSKLTSLHLGWFEQVLREQALLFCAPRGHFKSTVFSVCYPLWRLTKDRNTRIAIINETLSNAKGFLREIKDHIKTNQKFIEEFGAWHPNADIWNDFEIKLPRTEIRREPTVAIASVGGSFVSNHPDLTIIDDPNSQKNTETQHQRRKVQKWLKSVVLPAMMPHAQIVVPMTRWHTDDMAGYIKKLEERRKRKKKPQKWKVVTLAAEWKDKATGERRILFPEVFSKKHLSEIADDMMGDYNLQMLNDPAGADGGDFKQRWLVRWRELPEAMDVYVGVDLAIGTREVNSKFAISVVGRDKDGQGYIIEAWKDNLDFPSQLAAIKRMWRKHKPHLILIENNAYQEALIQMLRTDPETQLMPFKGQPSTGDKRRRINSLGPLFERGVLQVPQDIADFEDEYDNFPNGEMDLLDSLHLAMRGMNEQPTEPQIHEVGAEA